MSDCEKVKRITFSLLELFPGEKNKIEQQKWYYDHQYITFDEWEQAIDEIIDHFHVA